jgi:CrcB protein
MQHVLLVALGGGAGAACRHLVGMWTLRTFGPGFPLGTVTVNVLGSLLMGLLIGVLAARSSGDQALRMLLATGFLGGFTTFSSFSLDAVLLWERGEGGLAALYVAGSVCLGIAGLVSGLWAVRALAG